MTKQLYDFYVFMLMMTSAVSFLTAISAWKRRAVRGAVPLFILMVSIFVWAFFQVFVFIIPDMKLKLFLSNIRYFGIEMTAIAFYALAWDYKHSTKSFGLRNYIKIMIFPMICLEALWRNDLHHRFYTNIFMQDGVLILKSGPIFWLNMAYLYFFLAAGIFLFIRTYQNSHLKYKRQAFIIVVGAFVPIVFNLAFNFKLLPVHNLDMTPISFLVSGLLFFFALFHYNLLDVVPIARDLLVE